MAKLRPETIILKGDPLLFEGIAAVALTPGQVVQYTAGEFAKQSTALKATPIRVVTEQDLLGQAIETAIGAGSNVTAHFARPGDIVQVMIPAAATALAVGDQLEMSGDGTLRKVTSGVPVAEAWEALDNSGGGAEVLIKVQAI